MSKFNDITYYAEMTAAERLAQIGAIADPNESQPENQTKWAYWQTLLAFGAFAGLVKTVTASGDVDLEDSDYMLVEIDPNGSDRDVNLPAKGDDNHQYIIRHVGSANALDVKRDGGTSIGTIETGDVLFVVPSSAEDFGAVVEHAPSGEPEGTAIKSTGETGGIKFLREDGDGTCSWQTPSGGGGETFVENRVENLVNLNPSDTSWHTVSVSSHVSASAHRVLLTVLLIGYDDALFFGLLRRYGDSTDNKTCRVAGVRSEHSGATTIYSQIQAQVEIDSSKRFQWRMETSAAKVWQIHLVGYWE